MKKFAAITISLLAAVSMTGGITAKAVDGETRYPGDGEFIKTIEFSSLTDYAIEDGIYAFADGKTVKVYSDGEYYERIFDFDVTGLDISDSKIYCGCSNDKAYTIPEKTECEYEFPQKKTRLEYADYYYNSVGGKLYISNLLDPLALPVSYDGEYANLKQFGDKVYAVMENGLYAFSGTQGSEVVLEYDDYSATKQITIGQARAALKSYAPVKFVEISQGTHMTAIDLEQLGGEYFVPLNTVKTEENTVALLLCYTGNAAIVSVGDTAYILLKDTDKLKETELDYSTAIPFENAQMLGGKIYASPYVVSGTVSSSDATNMKVKVTNRLEMENILGSVFYEVEYSENGETVKGYVAEGFLSKQIIEDDKQPVEVKDPEYSDGNDTKTILIIFAVVLLVLAAIGYISYVSAKGKKKGKKKNKDKEED